MAETTRSPKLAPEYALHREVSGADTAEETNEARGINMQSHQVAHVQVVPAGAFIPTVVVRWWSAVAGKF
ncbi:unnamed protein product, partial [marine sediment metagenome]